MMFHRNRHSNNRVTAVSRTADNGIIYQCVSRVGNALEDHGFATLDGISAGRMLINGDGYRYNRVAAVSRKAYKRILYRRRGGIFNTLEDH